MRLWFASHGRVTEAFLDQMALERPDVAALRYFNERLAPGYDMRARLTEVRAPTLILNGAADYFGRASARELGAIPGSRVVLVPRTGHFPFVETAEPFRSELESFLELGAGAGS
jgi:pimeloyl-ACP methyl ester carboxylesterase